MRTDDAQAGYSRASRDHVDERLHYIFTASGDDTTRRLALLQAIGWQPMFRGRTKLTDSAGIDSLKADPELAAISSGDESVAEIFATVNDGPQESGGQSSGLSGPRRFVGFVLRRSATDDLPQRRESHQYKYGAALAEEFLWSTEPKWRGQIAATSMFYLPGAKTPDSPLMKRAREAVATVMS